MTEEYHAFIDTAKANGLGINLAGIISPHQLLDNKGLRGMYSLFLMPCDPAERERMYDLQQYRELSSDPRYVKIVIHANDY